MAAGAVSIGTVYGVLSMKDDGWVSTLAKASAEAKTFNHSVIEATAPLNPYQAALKSTASLVDLINQRTVDFVTTQNEEIRVAQAAAMALGEMGGAANLTAQQVKQLAVEVRAGVSAYSAIGKEVPTFIQAADVELQSFLANQRKLPVEAENAATSIKSAFFDVGKVMIAAFTVEKIGESIKKTIEYGASVEEMARKTGMSTKAVQELNFAASQEGVTFEQVGRAIFQMDKNIGDATPKVQRALKDIGLDLKSVSDISSEERLKIIAERLGQVTDQTKLASDGAAIFGRGFKEVLPLITADLDGLIQKAHELGVVLDEQTIKSMHQMNAEMKALDLEWKAAEANAIVPLAPLFRETGEAVIGMSRGLKSLQDHFTNSIVEGYHFAAMINDAQAAILKAAVAVNPLIDLTGDVTATIKKLEQQASEYRTTAKLMSEDIARDQVIALINAAKAGRDYGVSMRMGGEGVKGLSEELKLAKEEMAKFTAQDKSDILAGQAMGDSIQDIADAIGKSQASVKLFESSVKESNKATHDAESHNRQLAKSLKDLNADLEGAEQHGLSGALIVKQWGTEIQRLIVEATASGIAIPAAVKKWADAIAAGADPMDKALAHIHEVTQSIAKQSGFGDFAKKLWEEQLKAMDRGMDAVGKDFLELKKVQEQTQNDMDKRVLSSKDYQLHILAEQQAAEIAAIKSTGVIHDQLVAAIIAKYKVLTDSLVHSGYYQALQNKANLHQQFIDTADTYSRMLNDERFTDDERRKAHQAMVDAMKGDVHGLGDTWGDALQSLVNTFQQIAQISGGSFGGAIKQIAVMASALLTAKKAGTDLHDALDTDGNGIDFGKLITGIGGIVAAMDQATKSASRMQNALQGALAGAQAGAAASGGNPYATAAGGIIGFFVGLFRGVGSQLAQMREQFYSAGGGIDLLKAKAHAMGLELENWYIITKEGAATLKSATSPQQFQEVAQGIKDLLDLKDLRDQYVAAQGGLGALAKEAALAGVDLQALFSAKNPTEAQYAIDAINKGLAEQQQRLDGLKASATGLATELAGYGDQLSRIFDSAFGKGALEDLMAGKTTLDKLTGSLPKNPKPPSFVGTRPDGTVEAPEPGDNQTTQSGAKAAIGDITDALKRMGLTANNIFLSTLRETGNIVTALDAVAPSVDQLRKYYEKLGIQIDDTSLAWLVHLEDVASKNSDVVQILQGVTQGIEGMTKARRLDQDQFNRYSADAVQQYKTLIGRGVDANAALQLEQPTLQALYEAQKKFGLKTDDATQALIDQALAAGYIGDQFIPDSETLITVLGDVKDVLSQIYDFLKKITGQAGDAGTAIGNIPAPPVPGGNNPPPPPGTGGGGPVDHGGTVPGAPPPPGSYPTPGTTAPAPTPPPIPPPPPPVAHYHSGGPIVAHDGLLLPNESYTRYTGPPGGSNLKPGEVPVIALGGEFVISRAGVQAAGIPFLSAVNAGQVRPGSFTAPKPKPVTPQMSSVSFSAPITTGGMTTQHAGATSGGDIYIIPIRSTGNVDHDVAAIERALPNVKRNTRGLRTKLRDALGVH